MPITHRYYVQGMRMTLCLHSDSLFISPWVLTAFVALTEKELPFTVRAIDLDHNEQRSNDYLAQSVTGKVPVLQHDDFWLSESVAIAEYLAETFPFPHHPRLFPADLAARARCRQVMMWLRTDLAALRAERPTSTVFFKAAHAPSKALSSDAQVAAAELVRVAEALIPHHGPSLFPAWCIADTDLAMALMRLHQNNFALPPRLAAYTQAQWQRPAMQAFLQLPRPNTF
jgi:glutathione S-transferase